MTKLMTMKDAVARFVRDADLVVMEGFTHLIPFAAGHEIIRQRRRDLTLARLTPDLIYDQLIAAGCVRKMIFSWAGNPGIGPLHAFRRAVEQGRPRPLDIEERSEEHTSELQSLAYLVCRLLLEKKKKIIIIYFELQLLANR